MIFFSIGLPGRFAEWSDAVIFRLAQRALGQVERVSLNTLDELALAMIRTGAPHFVICSRQPGGGVQTALARAARRFVAVLEDPRAALRDLATRPGIDLIAGTRAVASSCASMMSCASMPEALVLNGRRCGHDPVATARLITHHLELGLADADIQNVVSALADEGVVPVQTEDDAWWVGLEEPQQALVNGALGAYIDHFAGGDFGNITWERHLFFIFEDPPARDSVPATRPVDITGRMRCLLYGPFINLPPGSWSARVVLGFSSEAAAMTYVVEAFAGSQLNHVRIQPAAERIFEVDLHFSIDASVDHPVQIRIYSERAAFDGRLALGYVALTRHATVRTDAHLYLTTMLGDKHEEAV
jgi:hypothetical protein